MGERLSYIERILDAYVLRKKSQLSFWHGRPDINKNATYTELGPYYQRFFYKAVYQGPFDNNGIPLLDYHGKIGKQYNPIAIAQYGLGHYNLCKEGNNTSCNVFLKISDYMTGTLEQNEYGLYVWFHHFDWDYRGKIKSPWYSGLAQGSGISLLARAYHETGEKKYMDSIEKAEKSLFAPIKSGGCTYKDTKGNLWIEEMITYPPTHILNGFIWALFSLYDLYLLKKEPYYKNLFAEYTETIKKHLLNYDTGFWSLYDLSHDKMLTSPFYHRLHIVQLKILAMMSGISLFKEIADKWYWYAQNTFNYMCALFYKSAFKILKY